MKAKKTFLLNNTITQNPNLARRAWFWHVASHFYITQFFIFKFSHQVVVTRLKINIAWCHGFSRNLFFQEHVVFMFVKLNKSKYLKFINLTKFKLYDSSDKRINSNPNLVFLKQTFDL